MYVNSCSQGALSDSVRAAYLDYLDGWDDRGAPWDYWVERSEAARGSFARLVNARPDDVAVTTSVSAGVSALASAIDFTTRPRVVISDFEFPTIGQIWHAQQARGADVTIVPADGPEIPVERFEEAIDERTAIVSITAVCYRNGTRLPVDEITRIAHERGALVVLDAYQAAGTYPLDVEELGVDVLAAGVLKYLPSRRQALAVQPRLRPGLQQLDRRLRPAGSTDPDFEMDTRIARRSRSRRSAARFRRSTAASPAWS